jgi:hypothetical protein
VPVRRVGEIIVLRAVAVAGHHVETTPVGESIGDDLPHSIVATAVAADVDNQGSSVGQLRQDRIDGLGADGRILKTAKVEIADLVVDPTVLEPVFSRRFRRGPEIVPGQRPPEEKLESALQTHLCKVGTQIAGAEVTPERLRLQHDVVVIEVGQHRGQDVEELLIGGLGVHPRPVDIVEGLPVDGPCPEQRIALIKGDPHGFEDRFGGAVRDLPLRRATRCVPRCTGTDNDDGGYNETGDRSGHEFPPVKVNDRRREMVR